MNRLSRKVLAERLRKELENFILRSIILEILTLNCWLTDPQRAKLLTVSHDGTVTYIRLKLKHNAQNVLKNNFYASLIRFSTRYLLIQLYSKRDLYRIQCKVNNSRVKLQLIDTWYTLIVAQLQFHEWHCSYWFLRYSKHTRRGLRNTCRNYKIVRHVCERAEVTGPKKRGVHRRRFKYHLGIGPFCISRVIPRE